MNFKYLLICALVGTMDVNAIRLDKDKKDNSVYFENAGAAISPAAMDQNIKDMNAYRDNRKQLDEKYADIEARMAAVGAEGKAAYEARKAEWEAQQDAIKAHT